MYERTVDIVKDILTNIVPNYLFCLTNDDANEYIVNLLCMPSVPASITFSCFVYVFSSKKSYSLLLDLLQKFLEKKIVKLLEEVTSTTVIQGPDGLIQSEHYQSVINSLLHLPDIISNTVRSPSLFFTPSAYNSWLSDSILNVYMGFLEDRESDLFGKLVRKSCILGLTNSLAHSVIRFLQLLRKERKPSRPEEHLFLLLDHFDLMKQLSHFVRMIPSIRYRDFVNKCLEEELDHASVNSITLIDCRLTVR